MAAQRRVTFDDASEQTAPWLMHETLDTRGSDARKEGEDVTSEAVVGKEGSPLHTQFGDNGVLEPFLTKVQKENCKIALKLLREKSQGSLGKRKIDEAFEAIQLDTQWLVSKTFGEAQQPINVMKNRFRMIYPYDDTRVVLEVQQGSSEDRTDYINASHIEDSAVEGIPKFIATQAPLKHTVLDFWEMAFQQNCPAIFMLTPQDPSGRPYYPPDINEHMVHGRLRITNLGSQQRQGPIVARFFLVQDIMNREEEQHIVHYQYRDWPDFGVPPSTSVIRELLKDIYPFPKNVGPFLVHCRAGIGRSGTFITIVDTMYRILNGDFSALDIHKTIAMLRRQRMGLVETLEQYRFCYQAVMDEVQELSSKDYLGLRKHNVVKGSYHIPWPQRTSNISTL